MAVTRSASAHWEGSLMDGSGTATLDTSGAGKFDMTWASRSADEEGGTSPEELIAAAHATCYSMALSLGLSNAGTPPKSIDTKADVTFQLPDGITGIHLTTRATVPGLSAEDFAAAAEDAKKNCPVSKALAGTTITLDATLE